jgi:hypothetical protein
MSWIPSQIDVKEILSTNLFSLDDTPAYSLQPGAPPRDTEFEDAVTSFVYTARMPFHPARLHALLSRVFILRQQDWTPALSEDDNGSDSDSEDPVQLLERASRAVVAAGAALPEGSEARDAALAANSALEHAGAVTQAYASQAKVSMGAEVDEACAVGDASHVVDLVAAREKDLVRVEAFGRVLRSKGHFWLAGEKRTDHAGEWGSAGSVLQVNTGGPWFASIPYEAWPDDDGRQEKILSEFVPGVGDRCERFLESIILASH